ncbi:DUF305 domain-containing protein [Phytohabitans rumicis]|uniref:Lipoprotein n=1 Tax=Phytohabitans rumicis TaxID=1076125 RepID=A0A6V8LQ21_9ACTN|nr:DUF305 domain-containing protein [Phytohabitans rumicis]GFJ94785.1 lipoprotein [Phytohabitans rumicis]
MIVTRRGYTIAAAVAVALAGVIVAVALRSSDPDRPAASPTATASPTGSPIPVIMPGRPGESASTVPSDQVKAPDGSRYNTLDTWFVRMMIPHHQQALEMAALAPTRAKHPQIRAIADRITAAQGPEVRFFRTWLQQRGLGEKSDEGGHDHGAMKGMQPPEAIRGLAGLTGDAFDKMFVDMMAAHHEGAITMCTDVLRVGVDQRIQELATGIAAEQQAEINRLREIPL